MAACWCSTAANASTYIVTLQEVGSNVVATGSGNLDTTGLTFVNSFTTFAQIIPNESLIVTGPAASTGMNEFFGTFTGPTSFGTGFFLTASSGSGNVAGLYDLESHLFVPTGYVSDTALSNTSTWNSATFASLGLTTGTYVWTWGNGADQRFTLQVGSVSNVPLPGALPLFATGLGALALLGSRRKKKVQAAA
jgi:hypothetical protein